MAEGKNKVPAALVRVLALAALATAGYFIWRYSNRAEGYTGGDILTTGTVEAVHVELGFRVAGRLADVDVAEGAKVRPGQVIARLETADLDVAMSTAHATLESARAAVESARAALEASKAAVAEADAGRDRAARDLERQLELMKTGATTAQDADDAQGRGRENSHRSRPRAHDDGVPGSDDGDVLRIVRHPQAPQHLSRRECDREELVLCLGRDERDGAPAAAHRAAPERGDGDEEGRQLAGHEGDTGARGGAVRD